MSLPLLHADFQYHVEYVGQEQQPVIVVDQFLQNAESLIDYAMQRGGVLPAEGLYPGVRSPVPELYKQVITERLGELICTTFDLTPDAISHIDSFYSLVSTLPNELQPQQQVPHYDKPEPNEIAMLHYLCGGAHGGTSFYRHKQTGFEFVDAVRKTQYVAALESELAYDKLPKPAGYINGDTDMFERINSQAAVFNRVLIYRCSSLHSGNIPVDYAFDMNPRTGRFTIASFLYNQQPR